MNNYTQQTLSKSELREQRLQELLHSCEQQVLQQVIGPFGLTPAMFDDKRGGNVTTLHNFNQAVEEAKAPSNTKPSPVATAADQERLNKYIDSQGKNIARKRTNDFLKEKRIEIGISKEKTGPNKGKFRNTKDPVSDYTGKTVGRDKNTHIDHVTSVGEIERQSRTHLFMDEEQRFDLANQDANLAISEGPINQSMNDRDKLEWAKDQRKSDPGKTNAESFGVDQKLLEKKYHEAKDKIERDILVAQIKKQGSELMITGAKEAGKNALRQAFGVLLYEFVNGSFIELKQLMSNPNDESLIDRLITAFKRVAQRVISKFKHTLQSALQGGVQGFFSNLLTFIINSVITTSAKVVTIIREGMKGLWDALKLLVNPPKDQPLSELCRQVTKIFAGVVTMGLGMMFEESIKGFIMSIPILLPMADVIALAVTGILTGVTTALVIYGIDRFFDWLSSSGTELLESQEAHMDEMKNNLHLVATWIESQYKCSTQYRQIAAEYGAIENNLHVAMAHSYQTVDSGNRMLESRATTIKNLEHGIEKYRSQQDELEMLMQSFDQPKESNK
ncbi:hypothetical protein MWT71_001877 [Vibrio parahaemolyticus]|nr:hypothetical protein [Vibrio parahaemolyticus]EGQ9184453.1 hypothetical protein [Vibrio parahaemolyticus]EHH1250894.1 hypothetical protein [Vibrio parahaemolyticus]EHW0629527.1 hypothetical protein [Vibrio parahaemolyticus]EJA3302796.1 hypothetical protein [Vibrio parahaemolyticus]